MRMFGCQEVWSLIKNTCDAIYRLIDKYIINPNERIATIASGICAMWGLISLFYMLKHAKKGEMVSNWYELLFCAGFAVLGCYYVSKII